MKPRLWIAVVVVLVLINIATLTFLWFQYRKAHKGAGGGATKDFIIKEVGLTASQQQQYDSLRKKHQQQIRDLNDDDRQLHDELFKNVSTEPLDTALLTSIAAQISNLDIKRQKITIFHFRSLRQMLSTQQQQKFDKIVQEAIKMMSRPAPPPPHTPGQQQPKDAPPPPGEDDHPHNEDGGMPPPEN